MSGEIVMDVERRTAAMMVGREHVRTSKSDKGKDLNAVLFNAQQDYPPFQRIPPIFHILNRIKHNMSDREGHSGGAGTDEDLSLPKATVAKMIAGTSHPHPLRHVVIHQVRPFNQNSCPAMWFAPKKRVTW